MTDRYAPRIVDPEYNPEAADAKRRLQEAVTELMETS